ncbi:E3 ubiquitin-protein ligase UPL5-like [Papaver somniferum]|uniref:E3 ubiquitin-protein ligase UPL5-like n=1 Tax=Papaver somniferum TaxID=3469 RepID=UPI000E6FFE55|nr:E3 ubiquitin-protein ligase UPL5-like [Papaver somniferum]
MHYSSFRKHLDEVVMWGYHIAMVVHMCSQKFATLLGDCLIIIVIQLFNFEHCYSYLKTSQTAYTDRIIISHSRIIGEKEEWLNTKQRVKELITTLEYLSLLESPVESRREAGEESIQVFLHPNIEGLPVPIRNQCVHVVKTLCLELCLLEQYGKRHPLYDSCRKTFGSLIESIGYRSKARYSIYGTPCDVSSGLSTIVSSLSAKVCEGLDYFINESSADAELPTCSTLSFESDLREFNLFSLHLRKAIEYHVKWKEVFFDQPCHCFYSYYLVLTNLSEKMDDCLFKLYASIGYGEFKWKYNPRWSYYYSIVKEIHNISKLCKDEENPSINNIFQNGYAVAMLIMFSDISDENGQWLLQYKNSTDFDFRESFVRNMFQRVEYTNGTRQRILIDRSQLLTTSFDEFARVNSKLYCSGINVEFKEEMGTGPGVFREWIFLVCQALFDPKNSLFLACPSDPRRFFPNPVTMDMRQLDYFTFCGRMVALALTYKVQVGITFDRVFFKQLSGEVISLEDVCQADPFLYSSCRKILEMDADFVDSDAMSLTFVKEIEEFGTKKIVELCHNGNSIAVNSNNREEYIKLLLHHSYVKPISEKVAYFARGFGEILCEQNLQSIFFRYLELKDLDLMLCGSDQALSVREWKAHTDYSGYQESDEHICWFWKVVSGMSVESKGNFSSFGRQRSTSPQKGFLLYRLACASTRHQLLAITCLHPIHASIS